MSGITKARLQWVDAGKGLSILLVVLYHATEWVNASGHEIKTLSSINAVMADLRMPVFFFLSGLFASKWINGPWRPLMKSKILLFAWVYLLWSFIVIPTKWLAMAFLTEKIQDDFLIRQLLVTALIPFRASGSIWFIWALLLFFLIAKITAAFPVWAQLTLAAALSFGVRAMPDDLIDRFVDLTGFGYRGALLYYVFFLLGAFFRERTQSGVDALSIPACLTVFTAWVGAWIALDMNNLNDIAIVSFAMSFGGVVAGIALAVLLQRLPALCWLGSRTLPIYLTHSSLLILILCCVQIIPTGDSELTATFIALGASAAAVVVGVLLHSVSRLRFLFEAPDFTRRDTPSNV